MANLLDKAIGYLNPKAGAVRAAHRRKMELLNEVRSYEGAAGGRVGKNWYAPSGSADTQIGRAGQTLRDRSRDLIRNHPLAAKIVTSHANNFVGYGITPRAKGKNPEQTKKVNDLFRDWSRVCFSGTGLDFNGGIYQLARMMVSDGEVYVRKRIRDRRDGMAVPLQLQILDAEYCDWGKTGAVSGFPGNVINQGVEFDALGNRRGYWMFPSNPKSGISWISGGGSVVSKYIPADEIVHLYEPQTNQVHGVPWLAPVMTEIRDLRDYELSENIRKKIESCMVGMVIPAEDESDPNDPNIGIEETAGEKGSVVDRPAVTDMYGFPFERMEPGMFGVLHKGKDIRFNSPAVSAGIEAYIRTRQRSIAAGVRMPYEIMTGDFSQSNFASGKLGILEYQRFIHIVQWQLLIPMALQVIWDWFIEAAQMNGQIPKAWDIEVEWAPPEMESITRLDDARADLIEMRIGKRSPQDVISSTGRDPLVVLREIDEWNQAVDQTKSKVSFDSDPRKVSMNGQAHFGLMDGEKNGDQNASGK